MGLFSGNGGPKRWVWKTSLFEIPFPPDLVLSLHVEPQLLPAIYQLDPEGFWCSLNQIRKGYLRLGRGGTNRKKASADRGGNLFSLSHTDTHTYTCTGLTSTIVPSNHSPATTHVGTYTPLGSQTSLSPLPMGNVTSGIFGGEKLHRL